MLLKILEYFLITECKKWITIPSKTPLKEAVNKTNPEKHDTKSFETKEIFTYSDYLVDAMTAHIDRERKKKIK